jgi:hypothetical protein
MTLAVTTLFNPLGLGGEVRVCVPIGRLRGGTGPTGETDFVYIPVSLRHADPQPPLGARR